MYSLIMVLFKKIIKKYTDLHPQLFIPRNDIMAFPYYKKYNKLYNRYYIAQLQNINSSPFPIQPKKFPIVMKPFINLKGMGLNSRLIHNKKEFNKYKFSSHFWMEYLRGQHLSIDFIINKGEILHYIVFEGIHGKEFGTFELWKEINYILENNNLLFKNIQLILKKIPDFTGCVNMESINNYIIETHLRVGDIDMKQDIILELIANNYLDTLFDNSKTIQKLIKKIKNNNFRKIYLIPIWTDNLPKYKKNILYKKLENQIEPSIIENNDILAYYFDDVEHCSPFTKKRWFLIVVYNLKKGLNIKKQIDKKIKLLIKN